MIVILHVYKDIPKLVNDSFDAKFVSIFSLVDFDQKTTSSTRAVDFKLCVGVHLRKIGGLKTQRFDQYALTVFRSKLSY